MKTAETTALTVLAIIVVMGGIGLGLALWALVQVTLSLIAWAVVSL